MLNLTRRNALLTAAVAGAAFGLPRPVSFIEAALAQKGPEAGKGFRSFKFGTNHGFILNDGVWEKTHDPAFIQNVSVEETKAALAAAGIPNEVLPIPFNITLLKFSNEMVLFDAGTGGQFQPTAGAMIANMAAAGIQPAQITKVIVSHFHPDHVFGLMSKAPDNSPVFPNAAIYVPSNEFKFWMDSSIFTRLPEKQHGLPKRLQAMFPLLKDKVNQYEWDTEVIPGIHAIAAPGHTPGHTAFVVGSGKEQLMVLSDTTNMPALFAKHPNWHGAIDADPVLAETTRRRLFDRAVSDKSLVTGYHFPFPAVGTVVSDGAGYTFVPAA
jgi:glyoxylase-like metal-dependent hydrolase (beta-lactamase superfamily II)